MKTLNLFIFVDALGWEIVQERSFLIHLLPNQHPCQSIFGYSSACDPTILTGCLPEKHGHFSCFIKAEKSKSPFKYLKYGQCLPSKIFDHHRTRNFISRFIAKKNHYTGYFQLYSVPFGYLPFLDYTEKKDIYEPGGILDGQKVIFEYWQQSGKPWFKSNWRLSDEKNIQELEKILKIGDVELAYLFTSELDRLMHRYGTHGPEVNAAFDLFEPRICKLINVAEKHYSDIRVHLFSDHGMANVTKTSDLMLRWESMQFKYGHDYIACWDSTMVRFWFDNHAMRDVAIAFLKRQQDGRIISQEELQEWGCLIPGNPYGGLFYLLPEGSIFMPSFMNKGFVAGMHGYDPQSISSQAVWLTNYNSENPSRIDGIFSVMLDASGLDKTNQASL